MSTFDLVVRNARLADGRAGLDIGVKAGRIAAVERDLPAGSPEIDAADQLVSPPFVDAHFHMDTTLSIGVLRHNQSGTLLEGIRIWGEGKPSLTAELIARRAPAYCDWAVGRGLLAIRSHVDVGDPRLMAVSAASGSTCIATSRTTRYRATSRSWRPRQCAAACRAE